MRRQIALAASLALLAGILQGCGTDKSDSPTTPSPPAATTTTETPSKPTTTTPEREITETTTTTTTVVPGCLCVFDIDRTLTGAQGAAARCPTDLEVPGVSDTAYKGGTLLLAEFTRNVAATFCGSCVIGIVTAGDASGPNSKERLELLGLLGVNRTLTSDWSGRDPVTSTLVVTAIDGQKEVSVKNIVNWLHDNKHIAVPDNAVHFFDDKVSNVQPFQKTQYNARQISCATRDAWGRDSIGLCGATVAEIVNTPGVFLCPAQEVVV